MQLAVARAVKRAMDDVRRTAMEMSEAPAHRAPAQRPMRVPLAVRVDDPASNEQPIEAEATKSQLPPSDTMAEPLATSAPGAPQDDAVLSPPLHSVCMVPPPFAVHQKRRSRPRVASSHGCTVPPGPSATRDPV
jgi:hypothetical protein